MNFVVDESVDWQIVEKLLLGHYRPSKRIIEKFDRNFNRQNQNEEIIKKVSVSPAMGSTTGLRGMMQVEWRIELI